MQLSEKHRENRVFAKAELKELLPEVLRPDVCVGVGCGNVSSSTGITVGELGEL